ncbi:hypothetical protein FBQ97_04280 [Acidobacteria bacterium ACD]|nr:MAG: hypothetical protein EDX89_03750 [Acidobacteriota bacterium]MDL1949015.1 hypothetical protein [Acidobacteria bacterium ACD]
MGGRCWIRSRGGRGLAAAWILCLGAGLPAPAAEKAKPAAKAPAATSSASGVARVDGKPLTLTAGYLFRAPDAFDAKQRNAVVLLVPQPLDAAKLGAAGTLFEAFALAPHRVVLEIRPDRSIALAICHDGFGEGKCYHTTLAPFDWKPGTVEASRVSGSVTSFAGKEETVFETIRLYYEARFDVTGDRVFAARR